MSTAGTPMLTISHQYGSGGSQIARDLGSRLQWSVWDKEIVRNVHRKAGRATGAGRIHYRVQYPSTSGTG